MSVSAVKERWEIIVPEQWEGITQRKCVNCGKWKALSPPWKMYRDSANKLRLRSDEDSEFSWRKQNVRITQAGVILIIVTPLAQCRKCMTERVRLARLDIEERLGGHEAWNKHVQEQDRIRRSRPGEAERRKTYSREWWRRNHGVNHHTWKKYSGTSVDAKPFADWANNFIRWTSDDMVTVTHSKVHFHVARYSVASFAEAAEVTSNTIHAVLTGKQKTLNIEIIEKILLFCGEQYQLTRLYPS